MNTVIFDIDGTLVDTRAALYPAFREVIRHFPEEPQPSNEVMNKTLGNPDEVIWEMLMPHSTAEQRETAFHMYEKLVQQKFNLSQCLIPGVEEMLETLYRRHYILTIASNCATDYLNEILDTLQLRRFFTRPLCLESVNGRVKADILAEHARHFPPETSVMIGDRQVDVDAAKVYGIPTIGCAFGFGHSEELQGAAKVVHHPGELPAVIDQLFTVD